MIIDCAVHPVLTSTRFNEYVGGPWNLRQLPTLFGEKCPGSTPSRPNWLN